MIKTYTLARMTELGPEPITSDLMTLRQARLMRVRMQRLLRGSKFVVINLSTYAGLEEGITLP